MPLEPRGGRGGRNKGEPRLCWAQSYVSHVTLSKSLPHSVLLCTMLSLDSWSSILCASDSENALFLESKLL